MTRPFTVAHLAMLVQPAEVIGGDPDLVLTDVTHDSRLVSQGCLFVAVHGEQFDGHDFVPLAVEAGAGAVLVQRQVQTAVPQIIVDDTRAVLGRVSSAIYGDPAKSMMMVGVTGTNGKTTVTYMLDSMFRADGRLTGVIGSIASTSVGSELFNVRTTPEAPNLHRILAHMRADNVAMVAMEVSSHAISLGRVDGLLFDVVGFTNLSQDHLDFHTDMEDYFLTKARLFQTGHSREGVVWVSSEAGARLAGMSEVPVTTVGWAGSGADAEVEIKYATVAGSRATMRYRGDSLDLEVAVPGGFNVANAALAVVIALSAEIGRDAALGGLRALASIAGRYEVVSTDPVVVVDYAHTPDAIAAVVDVSRRLTSGRVIVVLGAGGDRDAAKRPHMGHAAATADYAILTTDNPRSEDPVAIVEAMQRGAKGTQATVVVVNERAEAISHAIEIAEPNDIVLILGKGHEQGIDRGDVVEPFDDRDVARAAVRSIGRRS
ncbi:MAG: UDP-N-acetylmuramoyl-L-alanyl-D-glutamate--2,6-diaminopimelate ligase [Acidobacteria bacterium]|nr:UDP-N-acetylmuramoyl-L-alanyl-D-glutamate--2,6-diaminopimelate ligase [Acidobacteriota bacterium]